MNQALATAAATATGVASDVAASGVLTAGFTVVAVWTLFVATLAAWSALRITVWRVQGALATWQKKELA